MSSVNLTQDFKNTCRTILFEHFSDADTCTDLARVLDTVSDDGRLTAQTRAELELLTVKSFKEFVERFAPPVYEIIHEPKIDEAGNMIEPPKFEYTLDKARANKFFHTEKRLDKQLYYEMLLRIYGDKGSTRAVDYEFDDSEILKMMTPQAESERLRRLRKTAEDNYARAYFAEQNGENSTSFWNKYDNAMDEVQTVADDKLVTIAQRLADIAVLMKPQEQRGGNVCSLPISGVAGYLAYDDNGRLTFKAQKPVEVLPASRQLAAGKTQEEVKLLCAQQIKNDIENDYNDAVPEDRRDKFALAVLQKTMAPLATPEIDFPALANEKKSFETLYKNAREALAQALCSVAEKFVGVKAFFDQASNNDGIFEPKLIVTNCTATRLLESDVREKFEKFIIGQGAEQTTERLWLGILPAVRIVDSAISVDMSGLSREERKRLRENQGQAVANNLTLQTAQTMLGILDKAQIMTFFNTRDSKEAGFDSVTQKYLSDRKNDFENMDFNHAVYAYPNFTIMRERKIKVDPKADVNEGAIRISLPGAYVDAAYVAAGLLAASQQNKYLEEHGFRGRVNMQNVCVHVNLEDDKIRSRIVTRFNLADKQTWGSVADEARGFGMALCGVPKRIDGQDMVNTYVHSARTLKINSKGLYRRIDRVRLADFLDAYMRFNEINGKEIFKTFQRDVVQPWKDEVNKGNNINLVMEADDNIELRGDGEAAVTFGEDMLPVTFKVKAKD